MHSSCLRAKRMWGWCGLQCKHTAVTGLVVEVSEEQLGEGIEGMKGGIRSLWESQAKSVLVGVPHQALSTPYYTTGM